jgi:hypothetical protein
MAGAYGDGSSIHSDFGVDFELPVMPWVVVNETLLALIFYYPSQTASQMSVGN